MYSASPRFKRVLHARPKPSLAIALLPIFCLSRLGLLCPSSVSPFLRSYLLLCALSALSSSHLFFLALLSGVGINRLLSSTLYVSSAGLCAPFCPLVASFRETKESLENRRHAPSLTSSVSRVPRGLLRTYRERPCALGKNASITYVR